MAMPVRYESNNKVSVVVVILAGVVAVLSSSKQ